MFADSLHAVDINAPITRMEPIGGRFQVNLVKAKSILISNPPSISGIDLGLMVTADSVQISRAHTT